MGSGDGWGWSMPARALAVNGTVVPKGRASRSLRVKLERLNLFTVIFQIELTRRRMEFPSVIDERERKGGCDEMSCVRDSLR